MSFLKYLSRKFYGLPAYDSKELTAAKKYHPSSNHYDSSAEYDLHVKEMDPFMFGAIAPMNDSNDLLTSDQLEKKANDVYSLYNK